jgi:hypothetical protein
MPDESRRRFNLVVKGPMGVVYGLKSGWYFEATTKEQQSVAATAPPNKD